MTTYREAASQPRVVPAYDVASVLSRITTFVVVVGCMIFVLATLGPKNILSDTTPTGGDMGAHVWGPAFLRDSLLPELRLSGWTPDWYAGFPAYGFYMVLPPLAIVVLNVGLVWWARILVWAALLGGMALLWKKGPERIRVAGTAAAIVLGFLVNPLPYGTAFKLVASAGVVSMPLAAYAFGRLAGFRQPTPEVLSVASLFFLYDDTFTIYGGNIAATMAGEFAYSISLPMSLVIIGLAIRGMRTGEFPVLAPVLVAICALCHLLPVFLAVTGMVVALLVHLSWRLLVGVLAAATGAVIVVLVAFELTGESAGRELATVAALGGIGVVVAVLAVLGLLKFFGVVGFSVSGSRPAMWLAGTGGFAGLLAAFWVLPFYVNRPYMNDMGWRDIDRFAAHLWPEAHWKVLALAGAGFVLSIVTGLRGGIVLGAQAVIWGLYFRYLPGEVIPVWHTRMLPFYDLTVTLSAGLAVAEASRLAAMALTGVRWRRWGEIAAASVLAVVGLAANAADNHMGVPLLSSQDGGAYSFLGVTDSDIAVASGWSRHNFRGYEGQGAFPEYHGIVSAMDALGQERGCGRAHWEYEGELSRFGTPMALMLLPFWTDGCIGSMEGLYFESSSTTPYHFLNASEVSAGASNPQRNLPYATGRPPTPEEFERGIRHLQLLGVRYYMAFTPELIDRARELDHLLVDLDVSSPPWRVFEVRDSELVAALTHEPVVLDGMGVDQESWLEPTVRWYLDEDRWDLIEAADGPEGWERVERDDWEPPHVEEGGARPEWTAPDRPLTPLEPVEVSNIESDDDSISFSVDEVGVPVLVKMSYFPNWRVTGADGPYRVTPNLMVVIPTDTNVQLQFGRRWIDLAGVALTLMAIGGLVLVARVAVADRSEARVDPLTGGVAPMPWARTVPASEVNGVKAAAVPENLAVSADEPPAGEAIGCFVPPSPPLANGDEHPRSD